MVHRALVTEDNNSICLMPGGIVGVQNLGLFAIMSLSW
jgi:hypothetical protein